MKRRNIINHYSRSNKSTKNNKNISLSTNNYDNIENNYSKNVIRGKQFYLYEKPVFSI
jgi:hypothetical protein